VADVSELGERQLLDDARAGCGEAFAALWSIYQPQVLRFLRARRTSSPDDVASQVWLDIDRTLIRFDGDVDAFRGWLFTVARRRAIDDQRRTHRRGEVPAESIPPGLLVGDEDPAFDATDSLDRVLVLLRQLKPTAAEVVLLRVVHALPVASVAEVTGLSETNVRTIVSRSLRDLRAITEEPRAVLSAAGD